MISMLLAFLIAFGICWFSIKGYRDLTLKNKWSVAKMIAYSFLCATLAFGILILLVVLF